MTKDDDKIDFVRIEHPHGSGRSIYIARDRIGAVAEGAASGTFVWADLALPGVFVQMAVGEVVEALQAGATELPPRA